MGYVEGENVTFIVQNAQADMGLCQQIAQQMAQECDLVCAIATPMAQAAFNACMDSGKPVIYTAVSDPVAAMLANDEGKSEYNVTGTCDVLPVEAQLKLIRSFLPEAKKIGILYTTSETNSESQLKLYQDLAGTYGFEIVASGISTGADIPLACDTLLPQVDCLTNLTDNTVVSYLAVVLDKANALGKPVFGSEIEQVKNGCIASEGVEYISLGQQTGRMAAQVLEGAFAGDIAFVSSEGGDMCYNPDVAQAPGVTIPAAHLARGTDVPQQKAGGPPPAPPAPARRERAFGGLSGQRNQSETEAGFMGIFIGILEEGLIYAILALGVLITYRILDFPDLTVDSSFPLGAAVSAILTVNGMHPVLTLLMATLAGAAAGLVTGLIHVKCRVRDLLSGIITMTGLYSINLRIAGRANLPFFNMDTLFDNALVDSLPAALAPWSKVLVVLVIVLVVKVLLDLFMNTKAGFLLRAEGDNPAVVATLARDGGLVKIEGLIIANALVALSGAVMAQKNRVFEISMGTGAIVFGLAAVIIGTNIFKNRQKVNSSTAAIVGSIIYKACVALALSMGLVPQDLKLVTAALFLIILVLGNVRRKKVKFHA